MLIRGFQRVPLRSKSESTSSTATEISATISRNCFACGKQEYFNNECLTKRCYACDRMGHKANQYSRKTNTNDSCAITVVMTGKCVKQVSLDERELIPLIDMGATARLF